MHKHKICGSDGKLYSSRCHLRRAACENSLIIRPAHPDQCLRDEENDDDEDVNIANNSDDNGNNNNNSNVDIKTKQQQHPQQQDLDNSNLIGHDDIVMASSSVNNAGSRHTIIDYSEEDECKPKDYDLMKEKVLNKSKLN